MKRSDRDMSDKLHSMILEDRRKMTLSGVNDMESFDGGKLIVYTSAGILTLTGSDMKAESFSVETGEMTLTGEFDTISYSDRDRQTRTGFFERLFR